MGEIRRIKSEEFIGWAMDRFNWSKEQSIKHIEEKFGSLENFEDESKRFEEESLKYGVKLPYSDNK